MLVALFATSQITMIDSAAQFLIASGAGLGMVLILRWYWWRINAWSELVATIAPVIGLLIANYLLPEFLPESFFVQNGAFIFTVVFTTLAWLIATLLTAPTDRDILEGFFKRVRPGGWWGPFKKLKTEENNMTYLFISWMSGVVMVYSILFFIGYWILQFWNLFWINLGTSIIGFLLLRWGMRKSGIR